MASAASVDNWSDSEIRTKLAELGTPVGPVTETTRKILIKKLKRLLQLQLSNAGSPTKQRKTLARYSSGEESQPEESSMPPPATVRSLRRRTTGSADLIASFSNDADNVSVNRRTERTTRVRRSMVSGRVNTPVDPFDTDSDSDISQTYEETRKRRSSRSETTRQSGSKSGVDSLESTKTPKPVHQTKTIEVRPVDKLPEYRKSVKEVEEEEEEETEEEGEEEDKIEDKPPVYQSDFLTRLSSGGRLSSNYRSSLSPKTEKSSSYTYTSPYNKSHETRPSVYSSRYDTFSSLSNRKQESLDKDRQSSLFNRDRLSSPASSYLSKVKIDEASFFSKYKNKSRLYMILGITLALILLLLLCASTGTRVYFAALDADENTYPICGGESTNNKSACIEEKNLKSAMDLSKTLIPRVLELATKAYCEPSSDEPPQIPILSEDEAVEYLMSKHPTMSRPILERNLKYVRVLVLSNPHWEIEVATPTGISDRNILINSGGFAARHVDLPLGCYLRLLAHSVLKYVICIALIAGSGFTILFGIRWYKKRQARHEQDVYAMVNKILTMLSNHHEQNVMPSYLAVNNCRDELIEPIHRAAMNRVWEDAIKFIEKHESRVRTEMHSVRGENVRVWRWLPAGGPPFSPNSSANLSGPILGRLL